MTHTGVKGWWQAGDQGSESDDLCEALLRVSDPVFLLQGQRVARGGSVTFAAQGPEGARPLVAFAPALHPSALGEEDFRRTHGLRYAYVQGAMANGIASEELVEATSRAGGLGFFGAAGLDPARVEKAIDRLQGSLGEQPFGFNFIHSPAEADLEQAIADLYIRRGIRRVEAAAFLTLTLPLVKYRLAGIARGADGQIVTPNQVFAKISRVEVAQKFLAPAPANMLSALVEQGFLTAEQAELAAQIPVAEDITAEADSGGHTDNRPAVCLIPTMIALRDQLQQQFKYPRRPRVGAAGGMATPYSLCAAFAMGAGFVVTGSVNQACVESGSSDVVRGMLAQARQADVAMAPAADMFEMGVNVQVLKWGTMFPVRAKKLYELYRRYDSLEALPAADRQMLEKDYLRTTLEQEWENTRQFFDKRDPRQNVRAEKEPKHKMALIFRSYLGRASRWANSGVADRKVDYQIWCGPAMGAFNEWAKGSALEQVENRKAGLVAHNLMLGAAVLTRANCLRQQGAVLPERATQFLPMTAEQISAYLGV
jgi:PfaD family protein